MRKPVLIRILILLLIYCIFFTAMVSIQFPRQDHISLTAGEVIVLENFILPQAEDIEAYYEEISRWREESYSLWSGAVSNANNEDLVIALLGESLARGAYRQALASLPPAFLNGPGRSYGSSVYLCNMAQARTSLSSSDQAKEARLSRFISEMSLEFLIDENVFEFFALRGHAALMEAGAELALTIDPSSLALDIIPGVFEGHMYWVSSRPGELNPFEHLLPAAHSVIAEALAEALAEAPAEDGSGNLSDPEFKLRLGMTLLDYGEFAEDSTWAGIGRSLILSALSPKEGSSVESSSPLVRARLYRMLGLSDFLPRAIAFTFPERNFWIWTAAEELRVSSQNNMLEIFVDFPAGESHYMMLRGIRPFSRIQIYNMDWRSDPQFENYDSSGWVYNAQDQTLLVKMRHRSASENIRIFF